MSKMAKWIAGVFIPIGLLFGGIGIWAFLADREIARNGIQTDGLVIDLTSRRDSDGDITYRPVVEFHDRNGTRHEFTGQVGSNPSSHARGDNVSVIYPPDAPGRAIVDGFMDRFLLPLIFGAFGGLFAGIGFWMLVAAIRRKRAVARLQQTGLPIEARFLECFRDTSYKVNGRSPYRVACQATHPATGKLQRFESDAIWVDLNEAIGSKTVRVLIDPQDPDHYYVDLSEWIGEDQQG